MSAHPCYTSDLVGLHDRGHAWAGFPELLHPKEAATFEDHSSSIGLCGIRVWGAFQAQVIRLIGEVGCGCKFLGNMSTVDASGVQVLLIIIKQITQAEVRPAPASLYITFLFWKFVPLFVS
eukprot:scaffold89260_cov22-Tisochrysis_lutea.AAC.5